MSIEHITRIICDFQLSDRCIRYCEWSEEQAIKDGGWERRPDDKHICPECIEIEIKNLERRSND